MFPLFTAAGFSPASDMAIDDTGLVRLAQEANDQEAFGELIRRHRSACLKLATFLLRDPGEAEEEVQNACWKAFDNLHQFQGNAEFAHWLLRIVSNQCLMRIRVKMRAPMVSLDGRTGRNGEGHHELPALAPDPERECLHGEMSETVTREIGHMPPLLRNPLVLHDVNQVPILEVARHLKITVPAAKSRLIRARLELRQRILRLCGRNGHHAFCSSGPSMPAKPTRRPIWMH
jgi:RNA polymerase sigma-70 factor (ECF subfamily)